jgi:transposase
MNSLKTRKTHSSALKFKVVTEYLKGNKTISQICIDNSVGVSSLNKWLKQFKENGKMLFDSSITTNGNNSPQLEKELDNLYKKIGQLTVERDFLKKLMDS